MSFAASRAVLRRSTFAVRRAGIRNASSSTESAANAAKEHASKAANIAREQASKASEGLSRVASGAGAALSQAGTALGGVGGRTGRLIGRIQSLIPTATHYSRLALEVGKLVAKERNMSPPSVETFQKSFQSVLTSLRNPSNIASQPANLLNQARNMSTAQWASVGVVAAEVIGFFSVGEMIGRFKIVGYRSSAPAHH
ncbi:hypothetical protein BU24DRAFT_490792 [Aaosphaeria arxii CBS 175.79]|uniref:Mitochondrial F1F0-ATP synthase-like protein g subunit n=1 Tax=Aaosphaeria arxii CBS 175.79 TaxID=1450172 RepID=A0A6A5XXI3_9PLEO|nr:uncharacterized protein BU24DRAFT_490792 [Aaosphaeria arxii CBS 175.79]KAF2017666.1 hypothetical protein BU24DRAFT_490792 [Aaosphaeria arxii CBS 175.79]